MPAIMVNYDVWNLQTIAAIMRAEMRSEITEDTSMPETTRAQKRTLQLYGA